MKRKALLLWIMKVKVEPNNNYFAIYRVSHITGPTLFLLFSQVLEHIQRNFWAFLDSPGDEDFKTHLTYLPT